MKIKHIVGLDALRFVAAVMVVKLHVWAATAAPTESNGISDITRALSGDVLANHRSSADWYLFLGFLGVPIFFMISGFVIAFSAVGQTPKSFIRGRILRLLPTLWICTVFAAFVHFTLGIWGISETLERALHSIFILPFAPYVDGVIWTLVVELIFYSGMAAVIFFKMDKYLHIIALALGSASLAYWILYFYYGCTGTGRNGSAELFCSILEGRWSQKIAEMSLLLHGGFFATGVLIWWAWNTNKWRQATVLALPAVAAGCFQIIVSVRSLLGIYQGQGAVDAWRVGCAIWIISVALLCFFVSKNALLSRMPTSLLKLFRVAGLTTYPLYLLHITISGIVIGIQLKLNISPGVILASSLIIVIACSWAVAQWVEPHVRGFLSVMYDKAFASRPQHEG